MGGSKRHHNRHHQGRTKHPDEQHALSHMHSHTRGQHQEHTMNHRNSNQDSYDESSSSYDTCQKFFGDPLFSNRNVLFLFVVATLLPLLAWIPHFMKQYFHNRHIRRMEEERWIRMQHVKLEMEKRRRDSRSGDDRYYSYDHPAFFPGIEEQNVVDDYEVPLVSSVSSSRPKQQPPPPENVPQQQKQGVHLLDDNSVPAEEERITILQEYTTSAIPRSSKLTDIDSVLHNTNNKNHHFLYDEGDDEPTNNYARVKETTISSSSFSYNEEHSHVVGSVSGSGRTEKEIPPPTNNNSRQQQHDKDDDDSYIHTKSAQHIIPPTLCSDGITIGYDDWFVLRDAISMTNSIAAMNFLRWNEYLVTIDERQQQRRRRGNKSEGGDNLDDEEDVVVVEPFEYSPPEPFIICPGVTLTRNYKYGWRRFLSLQYYWKSFLDSWVVLFCHAALIWIKAMVTAIATTIDSTTPNMTTYPSSPNGTEPTEQTFTSHTYHYFHPTIYPHRLPSNNKNRQNRQLSSIFINAEDITIECDSCIIDLPGTHLSFGPHAKNVHIKGITFQGATSSSLTFHHHGSDVRLEDCYWFHNSGSTIRTTTAGGGQVVGGSDGSSMVGGSNSIINNGVLGTPGGGSGVMGGIMGSSTSSSISMTGAVADINSTSIVSFYRCILDDAKQAPKRTGAGLANVPGMNNLPPGLGGGGGFAVTSSLTIRT